MPIRLVMIWKQLCSALPARPVLSVLLWALATLLPVMQAGASPAWSLPHDGDNCHAQTDCPLTCEGERERQRSLPAVRHRLTGQQAHIGPKPDQSPAPYLPSTAYPGAGSKCGQAHPSLLSVWQVDLPPPSDTLLRGPPLRA
jgi:hypothetical protein